MKVQTSSNLRWAALVLAGALTAVGYFVLRGETPQPAAAPQPAAPPQPVRAPQSVAPSQPVGAPKPVVADDAQRKLHGIDLPWLKEQIPDNLYWSLGEPTQDPEALRARAEVQKEWDVLKGKVVSNTGTAEDVDRYYEHQRKLAEDYIQFSEMVLEHFGDDLSEEEVGAYELSIKMHAGRLKELPKQREEAHARRIIQEKKREAWKKTRGE